ncbi:MAG: hypothetical protein HQK79_23205, partial [Desulfobacterales bacterium]|nr:hypothetical protein [Desulfobacterales bacterium]
MTQIHTEQTFEEAIEQELLTSGGYIKGNPADFDREIAVDKKTLAHIGFWGRDVVRSSSTFNTHRKESK